MYDITGQLLRAKTVTPENNYLFVGDLQPGIHIYVISNELITTSGKLVIE